VSQSILAIGRQDVDPDGLFPPDGIEVMGASSDHLILVTGNCNLPIGSEVAFQLNYSALVQAMTSPFVAKVVQSDRS
jgi:predicted amino acid racemase